jgi:alpha-tubulin suppressor-like RCC1 family protein
MFPPREENNNNNNNNNNLLNLRQNERQQNVFFISIGAGSRHSVAISRLGHIYSWGSGSYGQLGILLNITFVSEYIP